MDDSKIGEKMLDLRSTVKKWVRDNINEVRLKNPVSIHINELIDETIKPTKIIEKSIEAFEIVVSSLNEDELVKIKPILTCPLNPVEEFSVEMKDWENCLKDISDEPPSIYLQDRNSEKLLEAVEEYRIPISSPIIKTINYRPYSFYRIFRNMDAIKNDWEYERCIYTEVYVDPFI
jgi:hypothetical protein